MKLHIEYRVDSFHYTDDGDLIADEATIVDVSLCHDECPDIFTESTLRISQEVLDDAYIEAQRTPGPADLGGRTGPAGRVH